jgi:hypothetical protein
MTDWRSIARVSVVASLAAACGGAPSPRQVKSSAETAASWAASVRWAVRSWTEGRVTRPYLRDALEQARLELGEVAAGLRGKPSPPGVDLGHATALLERETSLAAALQGDVERRDAATALAHSAELEVVERELRAVSASLGP